jgi:hypothetical protein
MGFQPDDWARAGISDGKVLSPRAIAYLIAGHVAHHLEILRLRYLEPLGR